MHIAQGDYDGKNNDISLKAGKHQLVLHIRCFKSVFNEGSG